MSHVECFNGKHRSLLFITDFSDYYKIYVHIKNFFLKHLGKIFNLRKFSYCPQSIVYGRSFSDCYYFSLIMAFQITRVLSVGGKKGIVKSQVRASCSDQKLRVISGGDFNISFFVLRCSIKMPTHEQVKIHPLVLMTWKRPQARTYVVFDN